MGLRPVTPQYYYTPANSDIDLFGLDPYPVQTNVPNNYDLNIIPLASAAIQPASAATTSSSVKAVSPNSEFANSVALLNGNNMGAHLAIGSADTLKTSLRV